MHVAAFLSRHQSVDTPRRGLLRTTAREPQLLAHLRERRVALLDARTDFSSPLRQTELRRCRARRLDVVQERHTLPQLLRRARRPRRRRLAASLARPHGLLPRVERLEASLRRSPLAAALCDMVHMLEITIRELHMKIARSSGLLEALKAGSPAAMAKASAGRPSREVAETASRLRPRPFAAPRSRLAPSPRARRARRRPEARDSRSGSGAGRRC